MCHVTPTLGLHLPFDDRAPAKARHFLHAATCPTHAAPVLDSAELLVSELVTNSVRYGAPPITVRLDCDDSAGLRVTVSDGGTSGRPAARQASPEDEGGRGMTLVDCISTDWGIEAHDEGKAVWFSLIPGSLPDGSSPMSQHPSTRLGS